MATATVTREALAATVPTTSATVIAEELAPLFREDTDRTFDLCRVAHMGVSAGVKGDDIAKATTVALAAIMYPDNFKAREWAESTSVSSGGAKVSRTAIVQRATAWADLLDANVTPTAASVSAAYKLATTGGSKDARVKIIASVARESAAKRENAYIRKATDALVSLRKSNRERNSEAAATRSADAKAEAPESSASTAATTEGFVVDTKDVDALGAFLVMAIGLHEWSEPERDKLRTALAEASAILG